MSEPSLSAALYSGPALIGCILAYLLFGALVTQTLTYSANFSRSADRYHVHHASMVAVTAIMCIIHLYSITHMTWLRFVVDIDVPPNQWVPPPVSSAVAVLNGTLAFVVQMYFARKVWLLGSASKKWAQKIPGIIIGNLALIQLGAALASAILFATRGRTYSSSLTAAVAVFLASTVSADVAITVSVIALLAQYQRESVFPATKTLLNKITRHTIENGMVTTVCAGANLAVFYLRDDNVYTVFQYVLGHLYALVLIVSLNRAAEGNPGTSQGTSGDPDSAPGGTVHMIPLSSVSTAGRCSQKRKRKWSRKRGDSPECDGGAEHDQSQHGGTGDGRSNYVHVQVVQHVQHDSDEALGVVKGGSLPQGNWDSETASVEPVQAPRETEKTV